QKGKSKADHYRDLTLRRISGRLRPERDHALLREPRRQGAGTDQVINYETAPAGAFAMFAIVATSGKQFKVSEGDRILVDRVPANVGETVRLDSVLMVGGDNKPMIGTPFVAGAAVEATVVAHRSGDKIIVFK